MHSVFKMMKHPRKLSKFNQSVQRDTHDIIILPVAIQIHHFEIFLSIDAFVDLYHFEMFPINSIILKYKVHHV